MIQRSFNKHRAVALIGAAVVFSSAAAQLHAQALTNLFGGSSGTTTLTGTPAVLVLGTPAQATTNGSLGSGYQGTLVINNGVGSALSESLNTTAGTLTAQAGGIVSLGGTFDAAKGFATAGLQPNTQYQFSITKATGSTLSLLTSLNFTFGADGTTFANTSTGVGILGGLSVNALTLFNTQSAVTFTFTTPTTMTANSTLNFDVNGNIGANSGLLGTTTFTLSSASITQVPEPSTVATAVIGLLGLTVWRARRSALWS